VITVAARFILTSFRVNLAKDLAQEEDEGTLKFGKHENSWPKIFLSLID
jgi:hypothetical protein